MRKADRLFEIIQALRLARGPVTAARLAADMEVSQRSIYRDIAALQAQRVPIEGDRGVGYILRPGYELPPLMFSVEETEAIVVALALLDRVGDPALAAAAKRVGAKIAGAVPKPLQAAFSAGRLLAWGRGMVPPGAIALAGLRAAIRDEQKLAIRYADEHGRQTERVIRPIALIYYAEAAVIVAWCELRAALRHFRADRIAACTPLDQRFPGEGDKLRREWNERLASGDGAP